MKQSDANRDRLRSAEAADSGSHQAAEPGQAARLA